MRLAIIRHGKADDIPNPSPDFPRPTGFPRDFDRQLVPRGIAQAQYLAQQLADLRPKISLVLSSPYPRALQTARVINESLKAELTIAAELEVDKNVAETIELIEQHAQVAALALVGHNPQLGELVSMLCPHLPCEQLVLKTGEAVVLDIRPAHPLGSGRPVARLRLHDETSISVSDASSRMRVNSGNHH